MKYSAPPSIELVSGRGTHNIERPDPADDRLVAVGWDRSFCRGITLLGSGIYMLPTMCGPKMDRYNRGGFHLTIDVIRGMDPKFLDIMFSVSLDGIIVTYNKIVFSILVANIMRHVGEKGVLMQHQIQNQNSV